MTVTQETTQIGVRPVAGHIGADITGIDIARPLTARTLHRVTLIGEVPVGPDGRESELVAGKPFTDKHTVVVAD